jgi:hypothetical protein
MISDKIFSIEITLRSSPFSVVEDGKEVEEEVEEDGKEVGEGGIEVEGDGEDVEVDVTGK